MPLPEAIVDEPPATEPTSPFSNENGSQLWLRYPLSARADEYLRLLRHVRVEGGSDTARIIDAELAAALPALLGKPVDSGRGELFPNTLIIGTPRNGGSDRLPIPWPVKSPRCRRRVSRSNGPRPFVIRTTLIASPTDVGALYGTFRFLRLLQTAQPISNVGLSDHPRLQLRLHNHWDNVNGTIERGYAGRSIWNWAELPQKLSPRYTDYARACASLGINGTVLNNVNANIIFLTPDYLQKAAALARLWEPYGIRIYLSINFSSPVTLGKLATADSLDPTVIAWWKTKADEIYSIIPNFGGFLVKANSEGQPGPRDYQRTHAQGANVIADALAPHHGNVIWRAFVYDEEIDPDRAKRAYIEFTKLDGQFRPNVLLQIKNGPIDFQPREPFHPLFGALKQTPILAEIQATQEYTGQAKHLVYLGTMWEEFLQSDTFANGPGTTVSKILQTSFAPQSALHSSPSEISNLKSKIPPVGNPSDQKMSPSAAAAFMAQDPSQWPIGNGQSANSPPLSGIATVLNTGSDANWCGHHFSQSNWYSAGRLSWNPDLTAAAIAEEWIRMTFTNDAPTVATLRTLMLTSRETYVNYTMPLGLHHLIGGDHYAPMPQNAAAQRRDWTAVYYHQASPTGIGFDRTLTGDRAATQYFPPVRDRFNDFATCPDAFLLWFHHLPWDYKMHSGETLWAALCQKYHQGVKEAAALQSTWTTLAPQIDPQRHQEVAARLAIQTRDSAAWATQILQYFQSINKLPIP